MALGVSQFDNVVYLELKTRTGEVVARAPLMRADPANAVVRGA